ncbi:MAG: hypothetical protein QNK37_18200 [Acidobacteriota bacterium]|nr:hypothetical protein [Acidobacteriota bacterium]
MTNLLVADSGGTKTDWLWLRDNRTDSQLRTRGLNPNLAGSEQIREVLAREVRPWLQNELPRRICFFGAGLGNVRRQNRIASLLRAVFPETPAVRVETDILGAAYACLGGAPGVAGILGTGSVAFRYDGRRISERKGGRGWLLGDEGGGTSIGRVFVSALIDGALPEDVVDAYRTYSGLDIEELIPEVYNHASHHRFLAGQVPFLTGQLDNPEIRALVAEPIGLFLDKYLIPLLHGEEPVVLTGGVAKAFEAVVLDLCTRRGIANARILSDRPVNALARHLLNMAH